MTVYFAKTRKKGGPSKREKRLDQPMCSSSTADGLSPRAAFSDTACQCGGRLQVGSAWRPPSHRQGAPTPPDRPRRRGTSLRTTRSPVTENCVRTDSPLRPGCGLREPRRGLATLQPHGSHSGEKLAVGELEPNRLLTLESARRLGLRRGTTSLNRTGNRTDGRVFIGCPGLARVTPVD